MFLFLLLAKHALWLIDEHVKGVLRPLGTPQQQRGIGGKGVLGPLPAIQLLPWLLVAGELVAIRALGEQSAHQVRKDEVNLRAGEACQQIGPFDRIARGQFGNR